MAKLIRFLYSLLIYALTPVGVIVLLFYAIRAPGLRSGWAQRFGFIPDLNNKKTIWLHAVSVGETLAAVPLVKALQVQYPQYRIVISCMTETASHRIRTVFGESVENTYAPFDTPDVVARFLNRLKPELLIIMETELWPNTIAACQRRDIPVILANARLSQKSANSYKKISPLIKSMLQSLHAVVAQHKSDAARFIELGLPEQALTISGNIKFDLTLDEQTKNMAQLVSQQWRGSTSRSILLAASTRRGEDELILQAFRQLVSVLEKPPLLVLVPRHPERFDSVYELCSRAGFSVAKRSDKDADVSRADILLGDTMGELMLFYGACDIAFVGGSLVPNGGHNMIEPAAWGVPIISGPHLFNFSEVSQLLIGGDAMLVCENTTQLAEQTLDLLQNPERRQSMGKAAKQIAEENRGALAKLLGQIDNQLQQ